MAAELAAHAAHHHDVLRVAAGALALALGGAPLGVLLIARRLSLVGDGLSHGILPGVAVAFVLAGLDPLALTLGALAAACLLALGSSLLARSGRLPEDASFGVFTLGSLALGVVLLGAQDRADELLHLLFGHAVTLDGPGLVLAAGAATATLLALALFVRAFVAETADPAFMKAAGLSGGWPHLLLMMLVAVNLVSGFRAFGALMTVGLILIPAAAARFWSASYTGQTLAAVAAALTASGAGLWLAWSLHQEPGPLMTLCAVGVFVLSGVLGPRGGLLQSLPGRAHLER